MTDLSQLDLYGLLGVEETCSIKELTTAFRKTALRCHPDKYPDDEEKKEHFLLIKRALELLADEQARKTYDTCRKQKKKDLDRKEQKASQATKSTVNTYNTDKLRAEVDRLRREGSRLVDEELENLHNIIEQDKQKKLLNHRNIIIKYLPNTDPYTDDELRQIFSKYGNISTIVNLYPKKALIEFNDEHISKIIENEKGSGGRHFASVKLQKQTNPTVTKQDDLVDLTKPDFEDFEAMMLRKMSQHATTS
ncbi:unnamed protein product [Adineta steineri]|uniref:J domain-containing protein n=1 Tax=Adineta steineri TaxID=433720 RepID=A0A814EVM0_9BILA|nr:unnamed protein product [Adineta steineri]CAF1301742.1 unnamed protein product [Adineta steineri]